MLDARTEVGAESGPGRRPKESTPTYFGKFLTGLLRARNMDQVDLAKAVREAGYGVVAQQEISRWMQVTEVPSYVPGMIRDVLMLDGEEERGFAWAYTYGRVHLAESEIEDVDNRVEAYKEIRRKRRKRRT